MRLLLLSFSLTIGAIVMGQTVVRGPYLQSNTHQSIIIMWRTTTPTNTKVWYGTDSTNLSQTKIIQENVVDHTLKIENLQPHTTYYYAVGTSNGILSGGTGMHFFKTHPVPGTPTPTRIWAIGDFGRGNQGQVDVKNAYMNYTGNRGTDVWLWLGDNAYQDGSDQEYQSKVFNVNGFSDAFSHVPFYPCPGNHDYNSVWSESTTLGIPYTNIPFSEHEGPYFDMVEVPKYAEAGGFPSQHEVFYSFDYGDVHFLSLNSEVFDYTLTYDGINQMKAWIESDLQQNTRKFTIVYFHQCPYSKGSHDTDAAYELVIKAMREKIVPLLEQYDVDLVINGHSHVFERSYLMKDHFDVSSTFNPSSMIMDPSNGKYSEGNAYIKDNSYSSSEGTVYIVCGNSGSSEDGPSLNHPAMIYSDGGAAAYGSLVVDVYKNRLDARYLKSNGVIGDEFTIFKKDLVLQNQANLYVCQGESVPVTANFTGGSDSLLIKWVAGPVQQISGAVVLNPTVTTNYTLSVKDLNTGQEVQTTFTITVYNIDAPLLTEPIAGTLGATFNGTAVAYQWNINGNAIEGATSQFYQPLFSGVYSVTVTDQHGCSLTSSDFSYGLTGIETADLASQITLFPNPADAQIAVKLDPSLVGATYEIYDLNGRVIQVGNLKSTVNSIDISTLESSSYVLKIEINQRISNHIFTKK